MNHVLVNQEELEARQDGDPDELQGEANVQQEQIEQ